MKQNIINARITFRKSPIHVLERFAFKDLSDAYLSFKKHASISECVIIQTCNRIELFTASDNHDLHKIKKTWASLTGLEENAFADTLEICDNHDAFEHLLKLTSGLESLVVGEEQILGQIKESIAVARDTKASGKRLNKLFDTSIRIGTRIRNSTGISKGGISLGSMAVKLAEENVDDIKSKNVLLIGTGEAATMVAKSLNKRGYEFDVTSRTVERSIGFSQTLGGKPIKFEDVSPNICNAFCNSLILIESALVNTSLTNGSASSRFIVASMIGTSSLIIFFTVDTFSFLFAMFLSTISAI